MSYIQPAAVSSYTGGRPRRNTLVSALPAMILALGGAAVVVPYLVLPVIPGNDIPNHLARLAILGAAPGSALRAGFVPHWALMPDLGLDLTYMALKSIASPLAVLRLCLAGSFAVMLVSLWGIQRRLFGAPGFAAAFAPLFVTGLPAAMGYVSFIMSCAVLMVGVWLYLAWRDRLTRARVSALAALAALAWLCHIAGFGVLMVFIGVSHLSQVFSARRIGDVPRRAVAVAAIALPGLAMSLLAEKSDGGEMHWLPGLLSRTLLAPLVTTGSAADLSICMGTLVLLALMLWQGRWRVAPPARAPLCALGLMVMGLPWSIGAAVDVGSRIAVPAMLILLATSSVTPPRGRLAKGATLLCLSALIGFRGLVLFDAGRDEARIVAAFRSALDVMPEGATLMVGNDRWRLSDCTRARTPFLPLGPHTHLAAYATIERSAWEPLIFAGKGMQPVRSAKPFATGALPTMVPPSLEALAHPSEYDRQTMPAGWPNRYDYLLVLDHGCHTNPIPALLQPAATGPGFALFKVTDRG